jgi:hypothetical protein
MKLIKINKYYYLLSDDTKDTGGKNIMWLGESTRDMNKYSIFPNSIYSGKPADNYKLVVASSNESFETEIKLDVKQIEKFIENNLADRKFSLSDIEECFNNAKEPLKFGSFKEYREYLFWDEKRKTEWDVECEMELVPDLESRSRDNDGQICNGLKKLVPLVNEQGFVNIIKIIK